MAVVKKDFGLWIGVRHGRKSIARSNDPISCCIRSPSGNCRWTEFPEVSKLLEVKKIAGEKRSLVKCNNILEAIGHTPLIRLNRVTKNVPAEVYVKAEYLNPGGSMKDRIAVEMIDEAERKGLLRPGGTIVEGTSGNTGMGLALVAAVRGYKVVFTITDKQSREKIDLLKAFGAQVIVCPTAVEPEDPRSYYSVAKKLAREIPNAYYPNQYENQANPEAHYRTTGPEIWEDTEGKITHFVCGLGTGGTASGVGRYLKEQNPKVKVIGVDPKGSLYYEYVKTGNIGKAHTYVVEGIGEDILPGTMDFSVLDDILQVNDEECFLWARRLAKREGIFTGGSGGGCISAALRVAKDCGRSDLVVALLPDSGTRYLSKIYNDAWMRELGYADTEVTLTASDVIRVKRQNGKTRDLIVVGPNRTVYQALQTMQQQDISQLPVFEDQRSIGTVFEDQILNLALQGKDLRKLIVREVMGAALPQVPSNAPVERVTHLLSHESPAVFVEMEEGNVEVLTKFDLMDTIAGLVGRKR
jgi:cystathionine beta-synthase